MKPSDLSALHGALGTAIFFAFKYNGFGWGISLAALGIYVVLLGSVRRWLMQRSLAEHISPSLSPARDYGQLKEYGIILAQVPGSTPDQVPDLMDQACVVIQDHDGIVMTLFSGFVLALFGYEFEGEPLPDPKERRLKAVAVLMEQMGDQIRIVHGVENCIVANWGKGPRAHFGPMLPAADAWFARLLETPFGNAAEKFKQH